MGIPTLLMYKDQTDDEPSQVLSVVSWNSDVLIEYLKSHLIKK